MIIGMDLMTELGLVVDTANKCIRWENYETPLKQYGAIDKSEDREEMYQMSRETKVLREAEERHARILDANYEAADLEEFV